MLVSVTDAKGKLTDLVRRAEAGDEVVLTRHGRAAVRLVPVVQGRDETSRRTLLNALRGSAAGPEAAASSAARNQDFLYGDDGMPR